MLRMIIMVMIVIVVIFFALLLLTGCTLVLESRTSVECTKEQCKAESSLRRDAGKGVLPDVQP